MHPIPMLTLAIALLLPTTGCDLEDEGLFDRSADSRADEGKRPAARRPKAPPPVMLLQEAVQLGQLEDDAQMAEALTDMDDAHAQVRTADAALREAMAVAITEGSLSSDAVSGELTAIADGARGEAEALTVALNTAHALLDPSLRDDALAALPPPPPADGQAPEAGRNPEGGPPPPGAHRPAPRHRLLGELQLDEAQKESLRAALGEPPAHEPPPALALDTFANDDFDAQGLGLVDLHEDHVTERSQRHVELMVALVPLLTDDQRTTLVELLRAEPPQPQRAPV